MGPDLVERRRGQISLNPRLVHCVQGHTLLHWRRLNRMLQSTQSRTPALSDSLTLNLSRRHSAQDFGPAFHVLDPPAVGERIQVVRNTQESLSRRR